jgi:hypothetical protein
MHEDVAKGPIALGDEAHHHRNPNYNKEEDGCE